MVQWLCCEPKFTTYVVICEKIWVISPIRAILPSLLKACLCKCSLLQCCYLTGMAQIMLPAHLSDLEGVLMWCDMVPHSAWRQCLTNASHKYVRTRVYTHTYTLIPFFSCVCTSLSWTPVLALILWTRCWGCSLVIHQIPFCYPQPIPRLWCQVLLDRTQTNTHTLTAWQTHPHINSKHTWRLHTVCIQTKAATSYGLNASIFRFVSYPNEH